MPEQIWGMTHRPLAKIVLAPDKIPVAIQRGIKVDPFKVRVIQEIPAPCSKKEVREFLGRLNYISSFISLMVATCELIFKLL